VPTATGTISTTSTGISAFVLRSLTFLPIIAPAGNAARPRLRRRGFSKMAGCGPGRACQCRPGEYKKPRALGLTKPRREAHSILWFTFGLLGMRDLRIRFSCSTPYWILPLQVNAGMSDRTSHRDFQNTENALDRFSGRRKKPWPVVATVQAGSLFP